MTKHIGLKTMNQGTALATGTLALPTLVIEGLEEFKGSFDRLCLQAGTSAIEAMLAADAEQLCGKHYQRHPVRQGHRWGMIGSEIGWHGGKAAIRRPRVRRRGGAELELPSWSPLLRLRFRSYARRNTMFDDAPSLFQLPFRDLAKWMERNDMAHIRSAPYHPMTQGKIERWHQTLKNRILLENYYLPGDLEAQIEAFAADYSHRRHHESINNLTPADVYFGRGQTILLQRERIKRQTITQRRLQHQCQAA